jgi:hypothetical protein
VNGAQFQRAVTLTFSKDTLWADIAARTAVFARTDRDAKIAARQFSPLYETFVNGQEGAAEETIKPGGVIRYRGRLLGPAVAAAFEELMKRVPRRTGGYAKTFRVAIGRGDGGYPIRAEQFDPDLVSPDATDAYVFSTADFSRLLDIQIAGNRAIRVIVPPGFFADAAAAVRRRFPTVHAQRLHTIRWPGAGRTREGREIEYPAVWIRLGG